ncbi:MAG: metallophosphoesterase family protein [Candidatus Aminicenantales bacterium]
MRYLIFTDIHGNLEALNTLLKFSQRRKIDYFVCLGDLVGYGASPNETIQKIHNLKPLSIIRGNHDKAVSGLDSIENFNPIAASAIQWTKKRILKKNRDLLVHLKKGPQIVHNLFTICHGAPFDEDYYIFGEFDAAEAFQYLKSPLCFFGHTHFPFIYTMRDSWVEATFLEGNFSELKLEKDVQYLINPGSVGQPRDRNPRAGFAIYDSDTRLVKFYRLPYAVEEAQKKILKENLPPALAERLSLGI